MKKSLFVLALAALLVLSFASSAFAFITWTSVGVNSAGPHADYQTGTTKCGVCHSVHTAPGPNQTGTTGGVAWTAASDPEMLLRSTVADSCRYCHIDTAVGGVQIYWTQSNTIIYGSAPAGHTGTGSSACVNCHAVHGASTYKGANTAKILKLAPRNRYPQPETLGDFDATFASSGLTRNPGHRALFDTWANAQVAADKYPQQVVFCSSCHWNYSTTPDQNIGSRSDPITHSGSPVGYDGADAQRVFRSHAMVSPAATFSSTNAGTATTYNNAGPLSTGVTTADGATISGIAVAFAPAGTCRACHDAGSVDAPAGTPQFSSFPHYTQGSTYLMNSGAFAGDPTKPAAANVVGNLPDAEEDGACLKCHKSNATTGVGYTF